ncbi:ABC transporter permease [Streptomyces sp. NBC_00091]|uniref:ABC transporter permease n=1 Tax=Streptomyces sp. NBC_00091 TaxID=2975648 RepID=UPI0022595F61|nr:FtsX-like permease family protein [Streptomyces sp. NBC_00091]MCX5376178.1 ABC transporter permease [Streptomyces sp. NBC_00091]
MSALRTWARDLAMGARFAFGGGREGWTRTLLTGVGVGLGVALLLISTAIPGALTARDERGDARFAAPSPTGTAPGRDTVLMAGANQVYKGKDVDGRFLLAEGPDAPVPPGLKSIPAPGEMAVSPALKSLLASADGALLRERLDAWKPTQVIGDAGLTGPGELFFYAGKGDLRITGAKDYRAQRVSDFNWHFERPGLDPVLMLLVVVTFVALLMPVAVFIAAAVRFGGERRDRRLAALRLVGADSHMVRRIAAGEALAGSVVGLGMGAGFFLIGRRLVGSFTFQQRSVFPADLDPSLWLAVLVALAVPVSAVAVTLFALRGVVIEPLGVLRTNRPGRRRIWWRLLLPLGGLALLAPLTGRGNDHGRFNQWQVSGGVVLLLIAITALLPWLLERFVGRMSGGPVSWQLAVRRLQVAGGGAARLVNGVAVAVAGAIALQMLFASVENDYTTDTGQDPSRAAISVLMIEADRAAVDAVAQQVSRAEGVAKAVAPSSFRAAHRIPSADDRVQVTVGGCEVLREFATIESCKDGDAFLITDAPAMKGGVPAPTAKAGDTLWVGRGLGGPGDDTDGVAGPADEAKPTQWTFPAGARGVAGRPDPAGVRHGGLLVTPSVAPKTVIEARTPQVYVQLDPSVPDAVEKARTAAFKAAPLATVMTLRSNRTDTGYSTVRVGLLFGATAVLLLIGASLLVSQLEQLRERRKLLSALVAFGTRRSTLSLSVLWQTALPIGLGLGLAAVIGTGLGVVLMKMANRPVRIDWASIVAMTGAGAAVVAAVTLLSLPPLLRLMRPDGLRTE